MLLLPDVNIGALIDGHFALVILSVDSAGNAGPQSTVDWWVDSAPPVSPTHAQLKSSETQAIMLSSLTARLLMGFDVNPSMGDTTFWYSIAVNGVVAGGARLSSLAPAVVSQLASGMLMSELVLSNRTADTVYNVSVWTRSQAGLFSASPHSFDFAILFNPPVPAVTQHPV